MRFYSLIACGAATALLAGSVQAAFLVNRNGVTWAATFEGDSIPTASAPAFGVFDNNGFAAESTDGNIYSYFSGSTGTSVSYSTTSNWSGTARTVEIRCRVPDASVAAGDGNASVVMGVNGTAYDLRFSPGQVTYNAGGLNTAAALDTSVFHTYRLVVDQAGSPVYSLYIDGNGTPAFTSSGSWFNSPGFDLLIFGDISQGGLSGKFDVDYISWTPGAFASPVPEPVSLALVPLAATALRRRRR